MSRLARLMAIVGDFLIAFVATGCGGSGGMGNIDGHDGEGDYVSRSFEVKMRSQKVFDNAPS